jgi:hypothetical protein
MGYYRVKVDQERMAEQGRVPWSIVRVAVAGPEVTDARELARIWRSLTGSRRRGA